MLKILIFHFSFIFIIVSVELIIRIFFPRLLKINELNFKKIIIRNNFLGWKQRKNFKFFYYQRYLRFAKKIKLKTNNFGILDNKDYQIKSKKFRVAIFGDNSISGFDTELEKNFTNILRDKAKVFEKDKNEIEILNFTQRDYCTLQYLNYYKKYLKKLKLDLIIYLYSHNHSRRNITIHESMKQKIFKQTLYNFKTKKIISFNKRFNAYDNIIIDKKFKVIHSKSKNIPLKTFLNDRIYLYSKIYDIFVGKHGLRKINFTRDIKNIEKEKIDYYWIYTYRILLEWYKISKKRKSKFVISNIPVFYNNPNFSHVYGQRLEDIQERKKLKKFCKYNKIHFYDNYSFDIKKFYNSKVFIHPRYSYLNKKGYRFLADRLIKIIRNLR